jgi:predicted amidophosphoribosyltransferase
LSGLIVQAILLRRFSLVVRPKELVVEKTKICPDCNKAISADAKICQFCLTEVDQHSSSSGQVASQVEIHDLQLQTERWRASTNTN